MRQENLVVTTTVTTEGGTLKMSRIVQCPKCRVLLQEPPPGNPYYQCGSCSTTLQAKHAAKVETTPNIRNIYAGQSHPSQNSHPSGVDKQQSSNINSKSFDSSSGKVSERVGGDDYARGGERSRSRSHSGRVVGAGEFSSSSDYGRNTRINTAAQHDQSTEKVTTDIQEQEKQKSGRVLPMAANDNLYSNQLSYDKEGGGDHLFDNNRTAARTTHTYEKLANPNRVKFVNGESESQSERSLHRTPGFSAHHTHHDLLRTHSDPQTATTEQQRLKAAGELQPSLSTSTSVRATKGLRWERRQDPFEKPVVSSPKAVEVSIDNRGIVDDDRIISPEERGVGMRRPAAVEHVTEKNWRDLPSWRNRRNGDDLHRRNPSTGSVSSLGTSSGLGQDYEGASETSSTVDEGERNVNGGGEEESRPHPQSRSIGPNDSGMVGNALLNKTTTDDVGGTNGPHHPPDSSNNVSNGRRGTSWDGTRMTGPTENVSINTNLIPPPVLSLSSKSRLHKSVSDDYVNLVHEQQREPIVVHHTRVPSDPTMNGVHNPQQYHHKHPPHQPLDPQNPWVARLHSKNARASTSGASSQITTSPSGVSSGSSSGTTSRPPTFPQHERSPSGSNLYSDGSASPGGSQLPPKPVNYPPLPLPGALPHVNCQYCHTLLAVPVNLPPPKKSTQKLRCGACRKINIFSVPQFSGEQSSPYIGSGGGGSGSDSQSGNTLFASSPDYHDSSSNTGYRTRSGRSLSGTSDDLRRSGRMPSDLSDQSPSITRDNSLGSADIPLDDEVAERIRVSKLDHGQSYSNPAISARDDSLPHSDAAGGLRSFSDGHSPASADYKSRFSRGPVGSRRVGPLEHGPGSGGSSSGGRQLPDDRSRFPAADHRPSSRRHEEGVTSSDSEPEHNAGLSHGSPLYHSRRSHGSGRSDHQGSSQLDSQSLGRQSHGSSRSEAHGHQSPEGSHSEHHRGFTLGNKLKGIMNLKGSLKELTHRGHKEHGNHSRKVTVNGLPIPDNYVVKAEERAGPIAPGNYWYDERAGFWGVIGDKCAGIIPPHIEEFEQPMSRDCAGGKTDVIVNGRELHERDLDILVKRGLPNMRGKSYIIDINGTVINFVTGEVVRELGRLAPSLEHNKRGAGMFTHR